LADFLSEEEVHSFSRKIIRNGIDSIAVSPLLARLLSVLVTHGYHDHVYILAAKNIHLFADNHKNGASHRVIKNSSNWIPEWVDNKLTGAFLDEFLDALSASAKTNDHPWRIQYLALINAMIVKLTKDQDLFEKCELIKSEVLDNSVVDGYINWFGQEMQERMQVELIAENGVISNGIEHALLALGNLLNNDKNTRALVNRWAQQLVLNAVVPNREEISAFVAGVVNRWDSATLVDKFELQVGKDLQYIRINGTVVGGLVGLIIYILSRMLN